MSSKQVIPAKAGIHADRSLCSWIPAFAGMTRGGGYPFSTNGFTTPSSLSTYSSFSPTGAA